MNECHSIWVLNLLEVSTCINIQNFSNMNPNLLKDMIKIEVSNADEELRSFHLRCWCCCCWKRADEERKKLAISMDILQIWFSFNLCFQFELFININGARHVPRRILRTQELLSGKYNHGDWLNSFILHSLMTALFWPIDPYRIQLDQSMYLNSKKKHLAQVLINPMKQQWCQPNNRKCDYSNQLNVVVTATYHHNWNLADIEASNAAFVDTQTIENMVQTIYTDRRDGMWLIFRLNARSQHFSAYRLRNACRANTQRHVILSSLHKYLQFSKQNMRAFRCVVSKMYKYISKKCIRHTHKKNQIKWKTQARAIITHFLLTSGNDNGKHLTWWNSICMLTHNFFISFFVQSADPLSRRNSQTRASWLRSECARCEKITNRWIHNNFVSNAKSTSSPIRSEISPQPNMRHGFFTTCGRNKN